MADPQGPYDQCSGGAVSGQARNCEVQSLAAVAFTLCLCAIWVMGLLLKPGEATLEMSWNCTVCTTIALKMGVGKWWKFSPRGDAPEMPPGTDASWVIPALFLKWDQRHKCLKATSPAQTVTSILTSGHWPQHCPAFNPNWLRGLCSSDPPLAIQSQTLDFQEHKTKFSLN